MRKLFLIIVAICVSALCAETSGQSLLNKKKNNDIKSALEKRKQIKTGSVVCTFTGKASFIKVYAIGTDNDTIVGFGEDQKLQAITKLNPGIYKVVSEVDGVKFEKDSILVEKGLLQMVDFKDKDK